MKYLKSSMFIRMLGTYILILIIPVIIGMSAYMRSLQIVENYVVRNSEALLKQTMEVIDHRIKEIENITFLLENDKRVNKMLYTKDVINSSNPYSVIDLRNNLYNFTISNSFVYDYYILFKNAGVAVNSQVIYRMDNLYDFIRYNKKGEKQWYELMNKYYDGSYLPSEMLYIDGKSRPIVTYVKSLGHEQYILGIIVIFIKEQALLDLMREIDVSNGGYAYIKNSDGEVMASLSDQNVLLDYELDQIVENTNSNVVGSKNSKGRLLVSTVRSASNRWTYVAVQPYKKITHIVSTIKYIVILALVLSFMIGLVIAYWITYRSIRPVLNLVNNIKQKYLPNSFLLYNNQNEYELIQNTLLKMFEDKEMLKEQIKEQIPYLRSSFYNRLLKGEFKTDNEIKALSQYADLRLEDFKYFVVAVVYLGEGVETLSHEMVKEIEVKRVVVEEYAKKYSKRAFVYPIEADRIAIIFPFKDSSEYNIDYVTENMMRVLTGSYFIKKTSNIYITVGNVYKTLIGISQSYEEAIKTLNMCILSGKQQGVYYYNFIPKSNDIFFYPKEIETRIIQLALAGEKGECLKLLNSVFDENFEVRKLEYNILQIFLVRVWGTILMILDNIPRSKDCSLEEIRSKISHVKLSKNINAHKKMLIETITKICEVINQRKKSHNMYLRNEIIKFIEDNYVSSNLSLTLAADEFKMSEAYLSQFFKEQVGENFSAFVEKLRFEKACDLLKNTELPIKSISEKVGYNSSDSFSRAFKRSSGISPSAYRKRSKVQD